MLVYDTKPNLLIIGVTCTVKEMGSLNSKKEWYLGEAIPDGITDDRLREMKSGGKTEVITVQCNAECCNM